MFFFQFESLSEKSFCVKIPFFLHKNRIPFPINCSEVPADLKEKFGEDY